MTTFTELTKQVHLINDLILTNMIPEKKDYSEESLEFNKRLLTTKSWFSRISWANKKRFILALIEDTNSVWTLSLLLKSIWNCRPKDAVISVSQSRVWSSYDQVPMDHNRTALPLPTLKEVMTNDRKWYLSLEPESQVALVSELLMISGGPIMWEVLQRTEAIYDKYLEQQLRDLLECNVVTEPASEKTKPSPEPTKKEQSSKSSAIAANEFVKPPGQAQKELDAALASWNANVKSIRDRMKLEEYEMTFNDGTKKKVWKVNRPKPEAMETVDLVQLLPSELGKRILMNVPLTQLSDCARVNKYWSYLVDELRSELSTRQKINIEIDKLKETIKRHDANLGLLNRLEFQGLNTNTSQSISTTDYSKKTKSPTAAKFSNRSNALSFRLFLQKKKPHLVAQKPIRNLVDLNERLEQRGAVDEHLWKWCENILKIDKTPYGKKKVKETEGLLSLESEITFPCPLMKHNLSVPLKTPLIKDPVQSPPITNAVNLADGDIQNNHKNKRFNLWSKDMSGLYPVFKLPSSQCPF